MPEYSLNELSWLHPKGPDNPIPALQLGVNIAQHRAQMDLKEAELADQMARTSLMRQEMLFKQKIQTDIMKGNVAMAQAIAGVTDWTDAEQVARVFAVGAENPMVVGSKAWQGADYMHRNAVTAKRLQDEAIRKSELASRVGWVYPEDGSLPYLMDARGGTHLAPFHTGLETGFTPQTTEIGGVNLVQVSPNKWQVIERPVPQGKLTDLEKEDLRYVRKRRQELVDSLPADIPKPGMFGGNKDAIDAYSSKTNEIAQLTAKEDAIRGAVTARGAAPAPKAQRSGTLAPPPASAAPASVLPPDRQSKADAIKQSFDSGKITKEQALQQLRELGFK